MPEKSEKHSLRYIGVISMYDKTARLPYTVYETAETVNTETI